MVSNRIFTILFYIFFGISGIVFFAIAVIIWLLTVLFDKRLDILHFYTQIWGSVYLWVVPSWHVEVIGRKKIDKKKTYVIVSNHQSQLDILVAMSLFRHFKWVSKREVFNIPLVGWNMRLNRYIELKRGDKKSIIKMMKDCDRAIKTGSSVFIFPEGTRSETGILKRFKPGAFTIAKRNKVPILPVAISGTIKVGHKNSAILNRKCRFSIKVLDEIPYESFADKEAEEIAEIIHNIIGKHVAEHTESENI